MIKSKVSPTEGFAVECLIIAVAVGTTVTCVREGTDMLPVCIGAWIVAIINFPQLIRFFIDKPARKHYTKFNRAIEILGNPKTNNEKKQKAYENIVKAAQDNYMPAVDFLKKFNDTNLK